MADVKLSKIVGGGIKPPVQLDAIFGQWLGNPAHTDLPFYGLSQSATVASTTLTEVLNINGSGVVEFLAIHTGAASAVPAAKFRIIIDGVTALDASAISMTDRDGAACAVGAVLIGTTGGISFGSAAFNDSFVVSIAGDGAAGIAQISYKRYLT